MDQDQDRLQPSSAEDEPSRVDAARRRPWTSWAIPAAVVLLTVLAFLPSLRNGFVNWDDLINFEENLNYRGLGWQNLTWMFTTFHAGPYQPLSWVTLGADYVLWGMDPQGYHLTSLLVHAGVVLAFYFLAVRLFRLAAGESADENVTGLRIAAAVAALLFGIHPLRVESVAWATERRDVVSGLFFVLTLVAYLRACEAGADVRTRRRWLGLSLSAYVGSLLGKGMGITLPLILVVLDTYPLRRLPGGDGRWFGPDTRGVWLEKAPYLVLALAAALVGVFGQISVGAVADLGQYGWDRRIGVALYAMAFYLYKTVLPLNLSPLYPMPRSFDLSGWPYVLSGLVLAALTVAAVKGWRRWPAGLALWLAYVVTLAPVSGLTQMGPQIAADRYTYLPCLGWALLGGWAVWWFGRRRGAGVFANPLAGLVIVAFGVLTWRQTTIWHDSVSLWARAGAIYPNTRLIHQNWGAGLAAADDHASALEHYQLAAKADPRSAEARNNIGQALTRLDRPDEALDHLRRAIELKPTHGAAYYNLGNALVMLGRLDEAAENYRLALKHRPNLAQARINLANTLSRLGKPVEAEAEWRRAIEQDSRMPAAYGNLATALRGQHRYVEAVQILRRGIQHCPAENRLRLQLALLLAAAPQPEARSGAEAVQLAESLARATGYRDVATLDVLAAAYAEVGRMEDAVKHAANAVQLAAAAGKPGLARKLQKRVNLYKANRPLRIRGETN